MRRLRIAIVGTVVLIVALVVAAVAIINSIDINEYRTDIAQAVKEATGRDLVIGGEMDLEISLEPAIVVNDVSFSNPEGMSRPAMATLGRLEAKVELLPLISGDVKVLYVVLEGLDLLLERNAAGLENWVMDSGQPTVSEAESGEVSLPVVQEVRVRNVTLAYIDAISGERYAVDLESVDLASANASSPLAFKANGNLQEMPFSLDGTLPSVDAMSGGDAFPIKLNAELAGLMLGLDGVIAQPSELKGISLAVSAKSDDLSATGEALTGVIGEPGAVPIPVNIGPLALSLRIEGAADALSASELDISLGSSETLRLAAQGGVVDIIGAQGFDLRITVEGNDLSGFSDLAGTNLPKDKPFSLSGRFTDGDGAYGIDGLGLTAGNSALSGWVTATMGDPRLKLEAQFLGDTIDLNDFPLPTGADEAAPAPAPDPQGRVFSADPLPLDALKLADADIDFRAKRVVAGSTAISDIATTIVLDGGRLTLKPMKAGIAGGQVAGSVNLDGSDGSSAKLDLDISLTGAQAGQLARELAGEEVLEGGPTDAKVRLRGAGDSQQALVASLDGEIEVSIGEGTLHNGALDAIGADVAMQALSALNPFASEDPNTALKCAVVRFDIGDGKAVAEKGIAVETSKMMVVGSGTIDLRDEGIDFAVKPEAREGVGINVGGIASMVRVTGTLANPGFGLDALETGKKALSVGAAIATGGVSLLAEGLLNRVTADSEPCRTALGLAATKPSEPAAASGASAPAAQPSNPEPEPGGGLKDFLGGFGKSLNKSIMGQ